MGGVAAAGRRAFDGEAGPQWEAKMIGHSMGAAPCPGLAQSLIAYCVVPTSHLLIKGQNRLLERHFLWLVLGD